MKALSESRVLVVTGAGISAESGIATFRGPGGMWRNFDPAKLATEAAFRADPKLVWEWYLERRHKIRTCLPNAAHVAVVQLAALAHEFLLVTQNVDDLHTRAAWNGRRLAPEQSVQVHGDIFVTRCARCEFVRRDEEIDEPPVPRCPKCGANLRPGVVWFGENLPDRDVERVELFMSRGPCDLVLVIGTTALFGYIVRWAVDARGEGGALVEINPEDTPISSYATEVLRAPAAMALPALVARLTSSP